MDVQFVFIITHTIVLLHALCSLVDVPSFPYILSPISYFDFTKVHSVLLTTHSFRALLFPCPVYRKLTWLASDMLKIGKLPFAGQRKKQLLPKESLGEWERMLLKKLRYVKIILQM